MSLYNDDANELSELVNDPIAAGISSGADSSSGGVSFPSGTQATIPVSTSTSNSALAFPLSSFSTGTTTTTAAPAANDPYSALQIALSLPTDSSAQSAALQKATQTFEASPALVEGLILPLLDAVVAGEGEGGVAVGGRELKTWLLDLLAFGLGRANLPLEIKTQIAVKSLSSLSVLMERYKEVSSSGSSQDPSSASSWTSIIKLVIQCLSCAYPLIFRHVVTSPPSSASTLWTALTLLKSQIISLALGVSLLPSSLGLPRSVPIGIKQVSWKFIQRVILVGTRGGSADPRRQDKSDPNIMSCPPTHPIIKAKDLAEESTHLIERLISTLFSESSETPILLALLFEIPQLLKLRPTLASQLIPVLCSWVPDAMVNANRSRSQIRSVEKALKIVMVHLMRTGIHAAYAAQLTDALTRQSVRLSVALKEEKLAKKLAATSSVVVAGSRAAPGGGVKREAADFVGANGFETSTKRQRVRSPSTAIQNQLEATTIPPTSFGFGHKPQLSTSRDAQDGLNTPPNLIGFDVTSLNLDLTTQLLLKSLESVSTEILQDAIRRARVTARGTTFATLRALGVALGPDESGSVAPAPQNRDREPEVTRTRQMPSRLSEDEPDDMLLDPGEDDGAIPSASASSGVKREEDEDDEAEMEMEMEMDVPIADPLNLIGDENEAEAEAERAMKGAAQGNDEMRQGSDSSVVEQGKPRLSVTDFRLPAASDLTSKQKQEIVLAAIDRLCQAGLDISAQTAGAIVGAGGGVGADQMNNLVLGDNDSVRVSFKVQSTDAWMLFVTRLVSRGMSIDSASFMESQNQNQTKISSTFRQAVADFVCEDFPSRSKLAALWLNEEWYNAQRADDEFSENMDQYNVWLKAIVESYVRNIDGKDKALTNFLQDVPVITDDVLAVLRNLSEVSNLAGITTLRDIVTTKPPVRAKALQIMLDLTTHPERRVRLVAINMSKRWLPDVKPFNAIVMNYALGMVRKLDSQSENPDVNHEPEEGEGGMEEGEEEEETIVSTYVPNKLEKPVPQEVVQQHVELLITLSLRDASLLDEFFSIWPRLDESVRKSLETLLIPLIRNLGPSHEPLLNLIRNFPPPAEQLALHVVLVLTDGVKPSPEVVAVIQGLLKERDLDPRFIIPIASSMTKPDLMRYLPKMVKILCGQPVEKEIIRQVFRDVTVAPADMSQSNNALRAATDNINRLNSVDLMVLLHVQEKQIGLKPALEAIDLCFTMTDLFPSEILATVLQRLNDEPTIPTLFLRTVIRSVTIFKSLVPFVSSTVLTRLITKKVWTDNQPWQGFIRLSTIMAPASFGAIMNLPRPQLKELVDKAPKLKMGIWQYIVNVHGLARAQSYMDILGDVLNQQPQGSPADSSRDSTPAQALPQVEATTTTTTSAEPTPAPTPA